MHAVEHPVSSVDRLLRILVGRIEVGPTNQTRQQGRLRQGQTSDVLVEVGIRRFAKPVDGKTATLAEVGLIRVKLEDLLLAQALFHQQRQENLLHFAPEGAATRQEEASSQLHCERAAALRTLVGANVGDGRAQHAVEAHTMVREEAMVFGSQHGIHARRRQLVIAHETPLGATLIEKGRDELGLELVAVQRAARVGRSDRGHLPIVKLDDGRALRERSAPEKGFRPGANLQPIPAQLVSAQPARLFPCHIERLTKPSGHLFRGHGLSNADRGRGRKHHRGVIEHLAAQARVDQVREMNVEVNQKSGSDKEGEKPGSQKGPLPGRHRQNAPQQVGRAPP